MSQQNSKSKVHPHPLRLDPDVPPDVHGRGTCRCGLPDLPDDPRHTMPPRPAEADARELAAGERGGA